MTSGPDRVVPSAQVTVPHAASSVRQARHLLAQHLRDLGASESLREDAVLVLSELVSNAVKHAGPLPTGHIGVGWAISRSSVHLEISDGGGPTRPRPVSAVTGSVGGRGLDIVDQLSTRWGVREGEEGVTVWAEVRPGRWPADGPGLVSGLPSPRSV